MTNEKNELVNDSLVIAERNTGAMPEILSAIRQEEGNVEEQMEKARIEAETEKIYITDPQETMEGPVSSITQKIKKSGEANNDESKEEADKKNEENI